MADGYTIGTGRQEVVLDPTGRGFKSVWEFPVTVTSGPAKGTQFTVTVDAADLGPDAVHNAIADQLAALTAIHTR